MAFATRYILGNTDFFGVEWECHFQVDDYVGAISYMKGGDVPLYLNNDVREDDPHQPIRPSSLEMEVVELTDEAYLDLVKLTVNQRVKVVLNRNSVLYWQGWLSPTEYHTLYNQPPKSVSLLAVDGLALLQNIPLDVDSTEIPAVGIHPLYKYILQAINEIGLSGEFYEALDIYCTEVYPTSQSPLEVHYLDTWLFYKDNADKEDETHYESLYTVLETILGGFGARIYQKNGEFYIDVIRKLRTGKVTYRSYSSSFNTIPQETLTKQITTHTVTPMNVPINMSLEKELVRPYSKLTLTAEYSLRKNLIRYVTDFTADVETELSSGNILAITDLRELKNRGVPNIVLPTRPNLNQYYRQGVLYSLGNIDLGRTPHSLLSLGISGELTGFIRGRLYIVNEADGKTYYYNKGQTLSQTTFHGPDEWEEVITTDFPPMNDVFFKHIDQAANEDQSMDFTEDIEITNGGVSLKGPMYLLITYPWRTAPQIGYIRLKLNELSVEYNEIPKEQNIVTWTNPDIISNEQTASIKIYSEPRRRGTLRQITGKITVNDDYPYVNPHLVYPGMLYYLDGAEYKPCFLFVINGIEAEKRLEQILLEDIAGFHSTLKWRLQATIKGLFNVGAVLEYKERQFLITSLSHDIHNGDLHVTMLQINEIEEDFLITESTGLYIIDESDNYIIT